MKGFGINVAKVREFIKGIKGLWKDAELYAIDEVG